MLAQIRAASTERSCWARQIGNGMGTDPAVPLGVGRVSSHPGVGIVPAGTPQSGSEPRGVTVVTVVTVQVLWPARW